jgi:hypothetical protein
MSLDENLERLGIRSYGVGITTLEEVFLKIAEHPDAGIDEMDHKSPHKELLLDESSAAAMEDYSIAEKRE